MSNDIRVATLNTCISYQRDAAYLYNLARNPPNWATLDWIASWQKMARKEFEQASMRLDRLNGHA